MRSGTGLTVATLLVCGMPIATAFAQPSAQPAPQAANSQVQPGGVAGNVYDAAGVKPGTDTTPEKFSDGTLAESANTTALATSTYHQPTGWLPGLKP